MSPLITEADLSALNLTASQFRLEVAMLFFQQERFSLGRAAEFAGLAIADFMQELSARGICLHYDVEDFEQDVERLRKLEAP